MITVKFEELKKAIEYLEKNTNKHKVEIGKVNNRLFLKAIDHQNQEIEIGLSDLDYHLKPTIKRVTYL